MIKQLKSSELNENIKNLRESQFDLIEQCRKLQSEKSQVKKINKIQLKFFLFQLSLKIDSFLKQSYMLMF